MSPKVSIIIPVYNGSNYLKEALDSALAQTYGNIEVIVINDGSNDKGKTEKIAKSYGNRIRYYKKKNGGVATALNLGIEKMTGEYFSWLSHDDMYYPEKIEKQIVFLSSLADKKVVLYSNYSLLKNGKIIPVIKHHEMLVRKKKYSLLRGCVNGITLLIPKTILDETGYFKPELRCTQDYDYWMRIQKKYEFIHMQDIISVTRLHGDQDSNVSSVVVSEGDVLWIKMVEELSTKEKQLYENTEYNFYYEMVKFLKDTPYKGALGYCEEKLNKIGNKEEKTNKNYKISIVIPFYNRAKDTINSIKSVQAQTYKNFEIILINDASTDDISKLLNYIEDYKNIILINVDKNNGPAAARNIGIKSATGDYIAFLDSDDEFTPDKIEYQLSEMLKHNPYASYTSYIRRSADSDELMGGHGISGVVVPKIINRCPIATPTVMIKRDMLVEEGLLFNESIRIGEDTCFWLEIAKNHEILLIDSPLTIVNTNEQSSAYDDSKFVVGMKNILAYLTNDQYYSGFHDEISYLCNDFYNINKNLQDKVYSKLKIGKYGSPGVGQIIIARARQNMAFRFTRKFYREGPRGVVKAINKRLPSRTSKN